MQHPFYSVDPALLPPAGRKFNPPTLSATLAARQEHLTHWHLDQLDQRKRKHFALLGHTSIYTPRSLPQPSRTPQNFEDMTRRPPGTPAHAQEARHTPNSKTMLPDTSTTKRTITDIEGLHGPGPAQNSSRRHDTRFRGKGGTHRRDAQGLDLLIDGLRRRLVEAGVTTILKLDRFYKKFDVDGSGFLDFDEFRNGLMGHGLIRSEGECEMIFAFFDEDRSGSIDVKEFLTALRGQLSDHRRAIVRDAFNSLDTNGDGVLSIEDLRLRYQRVGASESDFGARSIDDIFSEFCAFFDNISPNDMVSVAEFEHYYEHLSSMVPNDEHFFALVRNAWQLPGASGRCLKVRITHDNYTIGRAEQSYRAPKTTGGYFSGIGQTAQELVEIRPDIEMSSQDPRFMDAVRRKLMEMGYEHVDRIEVVSRS